MEGSNAALSLATCQGYEPTISVPNRVNASSETWDIRVRPIAEAVGRSFCKCRYVFRYNSHTQSRQKSLNRVGDSSVYLTVCWMFRWPR